MNDYLTQLKTTIKPYVSRYEESTLSLALNNLPEDELCYWLLNGHMAYFQFVENTIKASGHHLLGWSQLPRKKMLVEGLSADNTLYHAKGSIHSQATSYVFVLGLCYVASQCNVEESRLLRNIRLYQSFSLSPVSGLFAPLMKNEVKMNLYLERLIESLPISDYWELEAGVRHGYSTLYGFLTAAVPKEHLLYG